MFTQSKYLAMYPNLNEPNIVLTLFRYHDNDVSATSTIYLDRVIIPFYMVVFLIISYENWFL